MHSSRSTPVSAPRGGPPALAAGAGAREVLAAGGRGEVLAWFPRAAYLRLPGGILVLAAPTVHPGPLHLRLQGALPRLPVGASAAAAPAGVEAGGWMFPVGGRTWRGAVPPPARIRASAALLGAAASEAGEGSLLDAVARAEVEDVLRTGDLESAARALEGRGPGLTPSGDDVMAGVLFCTRLLRGAGAEETLVAVARRLVTGPIARAFAVWAARAQMLAPAHRLVAAAVRGDAAGARRAARDLAGVGESSGADFCLGLHLALDVLPER